MFSAFRWTGVNALFGAINRGKVKTLIYHNVLPEFEAFSFALSPEEFEHHLLTIKRNYNPVALTQNGEFVGLRDNLINVLLTVDDGFINNYEWVFPLLVKHKLKASFFPIVNCVETGSISPIADRYAGNGNNYDISYATYKTISVAQIQEMAAAGMTFGSHTFDHTSFSKKSLREGLAIASELKDRLAALLTMEVSSFAFPWGHFLPGQPEILAGEFKRVFTTIHGFNDPKDKIMHRNEAADVQHLEAAICGSLDFFRTVASRLRLSPATAPPQGPRRTVRAGSEAV